MEEKKNKRFSAKWLKGIYRLVVMNDTTFEEKASLKLSPLSLFIFIGATTIFLIVAVTSLIAFTPLREYIPGYTDLNFRKQLIILTAKADSMENVLSAKNLYIQNINNIVTGNVEGKADEQRPDTTNIQNKITVKPSSEDSALRDSIQTQDTYSLAFNNKSKSGGISNFFFFTPLKGMVTNGFSIAKGHYGIDIVAKENEAIKATLDGTVVFAGWTSQTGYVIELQHSNNLISIYKHNSVLLKKMGDFVKAGEPIAIIGNSGELTTGPHLHFELWYNGTPIDPQQYMVF
ncbi:MAG TPA: M23 family metallopeptidase [Bacteroidia bacterium]|nr:M23 family metallopeptidase [Bacteroidia bacterium]